MRLLFMMLLVSLPLCAQILLEAEDAGLYGVNVAHARSGYSGTGYVTGLTDDDDRIVFSVDMQAGVYQVFIGYSTPNGAKGYSLTVNTSTTTGMFALATREFAEQAAGKFAFHTGTNIIKIGKGWGWYDVDYIRIEPATVTQAQKPPRRLVNPQASASAQALFNFLIDNYTEKMLSGQYGLDEVEDIYNMTGKRPAITGLDLIDYSPSRVEHGAKPYGQVESWIKWSRQSNSILTLCWHWNAPLDLLDVPGQEWWRGFYTAATTFDLQAALADKNSERYQLLLRDIDVIADELQKFQRADTPILWRPLHEAAGGWFWWGAKGPEPFIELWRLLYNRLTHVHKLNNLIWVYTAGDSAWYPGDDVVDIVGLDIYTDISDNMSASWEDTQAQFCGRKMVVLSETGTLPMPETVNLFQTWWGYFALWSGDGFQQDNLPYFNLVYNDPDVLTLADLPDWRHYKSSEPVEPSTFQLLNLYPNPFAEKLTLQVQVEQVESIHIKFFNSLGQQVDALDATLTAGAHEILWQPRYLAAGVYIMVISTYDGTLTRKCLIIH